MALLSNPFNSVSPTMQPSGQMQNIYTANMQKPQRVSNRPIESVTPSNNIVGGSVQQAKSFTTTGTVNDNSTVQGQLGKVLASGSPLLKRAQTGAEQITAERGLNNSSIGTQAGESALISAALPIAQQDAQTYATQDIENQRASNDFAKAGLNQAYTAFNQDNQNQFSQDENQKNRDFTTNERVSSQNFTAGQNNEARTFTTNERVASQNFSALENKLAAERNAALNKELSAQNFSQNRDLQILDSQQKIALTDIQNEYQKEITGSQAGSQLFGNYQNAISQIMANPNMTASQATAALNVLNQNLKDSLKLAGTINGIDFSQFYNPINYNTNPVGTVASTVETNSTADSSKNVRGQVNLDPTSGKIINEPPLPKKRLVIGGRQIG